ncbi:MAG: hypothetical protein HYS74_02310 [Parcubacteria group bacterium]|nr:hypothetical protein [Parcubacteria group bacterium]
MKKLIIGSAFALFPFAVFAVETAQQILGRVKNIFDTVIPIIIILALVWFLWGVFRYVTALGAEGMEKARDTIIMGLVGLFVMVAVWGLVAIIGQTFGITLGERAPDLPQTPILPPGVK